jgi:hypothetical protein
MEVLLPGAIALFVVLIVCAKTAPKLPALAWAILLALLAAVSSAVAFYRTVAHKTFKQHQYEDGVLSRINNGRIISMLVIFIISALFSANLMFEAPTWQRSIRPRACSAYAGCTNAR